MIKGFMVMGVKSILGFLFFFRWEKLQHVPMLTQQSSREIST